LTKVNTISESNYIDLIRSGDQEGLSRIYDAYSGPVMGIIFRIVKNQELAEEILQQTMLKVWNKIDLFDSNKSSFFTWVAAIARNTAIDKKRLKSFENKSKTDSLDTAVYDIKESPNHTSKLDIEKITAALDPKYKIIVDKLYLEGYSQSDLSKELDIPLGTIKTRVRMAIKMLREEFKDERKYFLGVILTLVLMMLLCL